MQILADEFAQIHRQPPRNFRKVSQGFRHRASDKTRIADWSEKKRRRFRRRIGRAQAALVQDFHEQSQSALCLSGGGIRSAAFALGVIQGLARNKTLSNFHYLSTVSGGGYIGAWLSTWIAKSKGGWPAVSARLTSAHEAEEITHLRRNSRYLTQKGGFMSGDTWAAAALLLRNLVLNWMLILPLIGALAEAPKILMGLIALGPTVAQTGGIVAFAYIAYATAVTVMAFNRPRWTCNDLSRGRYLRVYQMPLLLSAVAWIFVVASNPWPHDDWRTLTTVYTLLIGLAYAGAWACAVTSWWWNTDKPLVYVSEGSKDPIDPYRLNYWINLSKPCRSQASVCVYVEDQQAVESIHFDNQDDVVFFKPQPRRGVAQAHFKSMPRQKFDFKPDDKALSFSVKLKKLSIEGKAIVPKDIRVLLREAEGLTIAQTPWRPEARLDCFVGFVRGFIVGAALSGLHLFLSHQLRNQCSAGGMLIVILWGFPCALAAHLIGSICFAGLYNWTPKSENDREWHGRSDGFAVAASLAWIALIIFALILPHLIASHGLDDFKRIYGTLGTIGGIAGTVVAWLGKSARTPATAATPGVGWQSRVILPAAAILFVICLIGIVSFALDQLFGSAPFLTQIIEAPPRTLPAFIGALVLTCIALVVIPSLLGIWINVNRFSLHAIYRNRLVRAFLGASRDWYDPKGKPDLFTGFRDSDNIEMQRLWQRRDSHASTDAKAPEHWRPFTVINIALNVLRGRNLALQDRKALPFVATPLWCGAAALNEEFGAFRRASEFGGEEKTISVGTAMAISGAAVSPNMGYHSSPLVSFLLTLFNVRLGWWYGNPIDSETYRLEGPRWAIKSLIYEAFGLTDETRPYVYLSDGGHFDNLGLYEMVRRRCHKILVVDAAQDETCAFEDLANSLARIQMDFGIPISIDLTPIRKRNDDRFKPSDGGKGFAIGSVRYSVVDKGAPDGLLLYLKPSFRGDEPVSILGYASKSPAFPHESTLDQWFTEAQFESYRALGETMIGKALGRWSAIIP